MTERVPWRYGEIGNRGSAVDADARLDVENGVAVVRVTGEIDLSTGDTLAHALSDACASGFDTVLDLSDVTFMDAIGLRHIEHAQQVLAARGHWLRIVHPRAAVRRLFVAARCTDLLSA